MEDILRSIFDGEYDITPKYSKTQQELRRKLYSEWDRVQSVLGADFTDHLLELEAEWEGQQRFYFFRAGYRAGVRLMLDALRD